MPDSAFSKSQRWILTAIHAVVAALLYWATYAHGYNYYTMLRFIVCGASIHILIAWLRQKDGWIVGIFFLIPAVLFNPIIPFTFSKSTWTGIDVIGGVLFLLSGLTYFSLAPVFWSGVICVVALLLVGKSIVDVVSAVRLTSYGVSTTGTLIDVTEEIEDCDGCSGGIRRSYSTIYEFRTGSGQLVRGHISLGYDPTETVDADGKVVVDYNPQNPSENRLTHARQTTVKGTIGLALIYCAFAAALGWIGVSNIIERIRKPKTLTHELP